jgi:DNA uptake protein ComE-like DNA-binding protein
MAKRHWLDPLARRLLNAADRIGNPSRSATSQLVALASRSADALAPRRAANQGWQLDVNRASADDWQQLPGCTVQQVDLLLRLQRGGVQLSGLDDLQRLLNLDNLTLELWRPLLVFRWYDAPAVLQDPVPVQLNQAGGQLLQEQLGLSPDRCRRLLRERGRGPFLDLADLQLRLQFPPQVIEAMIGKVEFTAAEPGPCLPDPRACIETGGPTAATAGEGTGGQRPNPQRQGREQQSREQQSRERQGREQQTPGRQDGQRGPKLPLTKG